MKYRDYLFKVGLSNASFLKSQLSNEHPRKDFLFDLVDLYFIQNSALRPTYY